METKLNSFLLSNSSMVTKIVLGPEASLTGLVLYSSFFFFWRSPLWKDFDIQIFFYSWVQLLHRNASALSQNSCHGKSFSFFILNNLFNLFCTYSLWLSVFFVCDWQTISPFPLLQGKFVQAITEECIKIRMETTNPHGFRRSKFLGDLY